MRTLDTGWRDLARGYQRAHELEKRFAEAWAGRVEDARRRRLKGCLLVGLIGAALLFVSALVLLRPVSLPDAAAAFVLALAAAAGALWALVSRRGHVPPPSIVQRWWAGIRKAAPRRRRARGEYGDEGERSFASILGSALPKSYVAVEGLLVARRLDADLLVVGPTGIWVFESKYWSGAIVARAGAWSRRKRFFEPGGIEKHKDEEIRPFDAQWLREGEAVRETLRRRARRRPDLAGLVSGGLVFTHPEVDLEIDGSCRAAWGTPGQWANRLRRSPEVPWFSEELRLEALDALLAWADKLDEGDALGRRSATELAEALFAEAEAYMAGGTRRRD